MGKTFDDCDQKRCKIEINNILVCSDKHKKFTDEYEINKDTIRDLQNYKEYKKGVTIVNKFNCGKCSDSDDEDD